MTQNIVPQAAHVFLLLFLGLSLQKGMQFIITKELDMQNTTMLTHLPSRNRNIIRLEGFSSGVIACFSQYVSPWTVTPQFTVGKEGN